MKEKSYLGYSPLGFHRVAYTEWGNPTQRAPVICVHGLTRNGRDFDRLAEVLQQETQVFCPDMVGRGKSEKLSDPSLYNYPQYLSDLAALIARAGTRNIDWIGTSMGGILGMILASAPNTPIRRLVINDIGPLIPAAAMKRIAEYAGNPPEFSSVSEVEKYLRKTQAGFGSLSGDDWEHMATHSHKMLPSKKLTLAYDPGIIKNFEAALTEDINMWALYDKIRCSTLVIRGTASDVLTAEVAKEMTERGPKAQLIALKAGHAPGLMDMTQISLIAGFLRS